MKLNRAYVFIAIAGIGLAAAAMNFGSATAQRDAQREQRGIDDSRLKAVEAEPGAWLTNGRDFKQTYFSPLTEINAANASKLGFAWEYDVDSQDGMQTTPIVVDGVMYATGPKGAAFAVDARTGREIWKFVPDVDPDIARKVCCGPINRGSTVWKGIVYVASLDGFLYALDATHGRVLWKAETITDRERGYTVTGAPQIAGDVVVIGNAGAELDARGYVTAFDLKTGRKMWRFFTVPGDPKKGFEHPELAEAAKTWDPNSRWDVGLGGTAWDSFAYDPDLDILYVGTGNGSPHAREIRSPSGGDNLYLASILAIKPKTGRMLWYYQTTPADNWDYTATQKMIMADLNIGGRKRQVIMQAPKNGFFYVLDRLTGELLSAKPYATVTWASHVDMKTGKPVETGQGDYSKEPKMVFPGAGGAHNWQPMSYNPKTGLVYIPVMESAAIFAMPKGTFQYKRGGDNQGSVYIYPVRGSWGFDNSWAKELLPPIEKLAKGQPDYTVRGVLRAWDPIKAKVVWEVDTSGPWRGEVFSTWNGGGVMTTASNLLFQGRGTGKLEILDARTGQQVASIDVGTSMMAAPMTYMIDGEQYVAIMAGVGGARGKTYPPESAAYKYGNKGRIVAFKLGGGSVPHPPMVVRGPQDLPPPVARNGTADQVTRGGLLFQTNCSLCHTNNGASGSIPDLRKMTAQTHSEFLDIVLKGIRADKGMGGFGDILSRREAEDVHAYLIDLAWSDYEKRRPATTVH